MTLIDEAPALQAHEQETCELQPTLPLRDVILAKFRDVAAAQGKALAGPLTDDLVLLDSGLDSLCFAIVVATLEDELGFDPFTESEDVYFPVTLGDFVRFYERAR
jgi:acyl carrier protein